MSNFFEQELRKLFGDGQLIRSPKFVGRACLGDLDGDLRVRAEFVTMGYADHYEALRLTVLKRTEGEVDRLSLRFGDILGMKPVPGNPNFPKGVSPHVWSDRGTLEWYAFRPAAADYEALRRAAGDYLEVFRELERPAPVHKPRGRPAAPGRAGGRLLRGGRRRPAPL